MVKFKENDIYALKIENIDEKYDGKYIIIIKQSIPEWKDFDGKSLFRFKITKEKKLPKLDEINSLEYIITNIENELAKYFPRNSSIPFEEFKKEIDKRKVYPDKYGYLYTCLSSILWINKNIPENLIFIGNKKLDKPEKEYIPFSPYGRKYQAKTWKNIIEELIKKYEDYNLKKSYLFDYKIAEKEKKSCLAQIAISLEGDIFVKIIQEKGLLKELLNEEVVEDSLTYVGGEDKDPYDIED